MPDKVAPSLTTVKLGAITPIQQRHPPKKLGAAAAAAAAYRDHAVQDVVPPEALDADADLHHGHVVGRLRELRGRHQVSSCEVEPLTPRDGACGTATAGNCLRQGPKHEAPCLARNQCPGTCTLVAPGGQPRRRAAEVVVRPSGSPGLEGSVQWLCRNRNTADRNGGEAPAQAHASGTPWPERKVQQHQAGDACLEEGLRIHVHNVGAQALHLPFAHRVTPPKPVQLLGFANV